MTTEELRDKIARQLESLGPDEVEVIAEITDRIVMGRQLYGELRIDTDNRDWMKELEAEILDSSVYSAVKIIKRRRAM